MDATDQVAKAEFDEALADDMRRERHLLWGELVVLAFIALVIAARWAIFGNA
jgi:hypothetical protein